MGQGSRFNGGKSGYSGLRTRGGKTILQNKINDIISNNHILKDLINKGVKINIPNVLFTAEDKTGMVVWLEKGDEKGGLYHIVNGNGTKPGHAEDFKKAFGITKEQIPNHIKNVITKGRLVQSKKIKVSGDRVGFERIYYYKGKYHLLTAIGTNGYIVSAYPYKFKKK